MKRMWIGIALMALVLAAGLWVAEVMEQVHYPLAEDLDRAAQLALEEQWDTANVLAVRTEQTWQKKRPVTAAFAEHEPLENIDALFAQLEVYAVTRDAPSFSAACVYLARQLEALGECHSFTIFNLL